MLRAVMSGLDRGFALISAQLPVSAFLVIRLLVLKVFYR